MKCNFYMLSKKLFITKAVIISVVILMSVGIVSGAGSDGNATYDAKETAGSVTLRLTIDSGPSKGEYKSYSKTIVAPSGAYMIQKPGSSIAHVVNTCSAGFLGWYYLNPKQVSFYNLDFQEDSCPAVATGFYSSWQTLYPHPQGSWFSIGSGDSTKGCRVVGDDQVWSGTKPGPYSVGSFTWNIPCNYKADDSVSHEFITSVQNWVSDAVGKCTIQKNGAGPFSKNAGDATSSW